MNFSRKTMALAFVLCLLSTAAAGAADWSNGGQGLEAEPITWRDADGTHRGWVASEEAAVLSPRWEGGRLRNPATGKLPEGEVFRSTAGAAFVRLSERVGRDDLRDPQLSPVVYSAPDRSRAAPMALTGEVVAQYASASEREAATSLATSLGLVETGRRGEDGEFAIYQAPDPWSAFEAAEALNASGRVQLAAPQFFRTMEPRQIPNDPLFGDQWNLNNTGQSLGVVGQDLNIIEVWDDYRGTGEEIIGIVDEDLDLDHVDLADNVLELLSHDFIEGDQDTSNSTLSHGTKVAGTAAAAGNNQIGCSGVAPGAALVGLRIPLDLLEDSVSAAAFEHERGAIDIYNSSWGPIDAQEFLSGPGLLTWNALQTGVASGRGGLGNIYVWAAGNGGDKDNINYDGFANNRYVIAVGGVTNQGKRASFSEKGACLAVCAPSGGLGLVTTDPMGSEGSSMSNYSMTFSGTSAAAPEIAGVAALMLQANPGLQWRDVKAILMSTARRNDTGDSDWIENGAGFWVNHKYGFGVVDTAAAVARAEDWIGGGLGDEVSPVVVTSQVNVAIPDQNSGGVSHTITVGSDFLVEWVDVELTCQDHTGIGDLEIVLVSPSGAESRLADSGLSISDRAYDGWRMGTARNFLESSKGNWTLRIADNGTLGAGTFNSWTLRIYGTSSAPEDIWPEEGGGGGIGGGTTPISLDTGGPGGGCSLNQGAQDFALILAMLPVLLFRLRRRNGGS